MAWEPAPDAIVTLHDSGTGNMGDVSDETSGARFSLAGTPYVLVWIRVHFGGSVTGDADMAIRIDSRLGTYHDVTLDTVRDAGSGSAGNDVNYRITREEYKDWVFQSGDVLTLEWTNPDGTGNLTWGIEIGLADATKRYQ